MKHLVIVAVLCAACDATGIELTSSDAADDHRVDPDVYYDPPYDPPWPDPVDPDPEPDCVGLTSPFGGICNIVEQCGCMPGFACDFMVDSATCTIIEDCVASLGTLPPEAECSTAGQCRPGTACIAAGGESVGRCREWCRDSSDCSVAGRECGEEISFTMPSPCTGTGSVPYLVCTLGCPPSAECDLFARGDDPTGCPDGETCVRDAPIAAGGCDINMCIPAGTAAEGDECGSSGRDCIRGTACYGNATDGYYCRYYCDMSHECETGTCTALGSESMPGLGICI
jgi:hypothetical protein